MTRLRVVIADDEPIARRRLKRLLGGLDNVEVVGEAGDGRSTLASIERTSPDLVLVDIQMPEINGLELSRRLQDGRPLVVFVTAFDRFALDAFDVQAVDYLLKPVSATRLGAAIERVRHRMALESRGRVTIRQDFSPARRWIDRLPIRSEGTVALVPVTDIDWIEAADNYAIVHAGRASHIMRETLSRLTRDLDPRAFVRIHRSTIVRIDRIVSLEPATRGDYAVRLRNGTALTLSRTHRAALESAIGRRL